MMSRKFLVKNGLSKKHQKRKRVVKI
jgi:hypothetical protein